MQTFEECMEKSNLEIAFEEPITDERVAKLLYIHDKICEQLSGYPNFGGIDFCDVGANGIQIRAHHNQVKGYCYGEQVTLKYSLSNYNEAVKRFVNMWKKYDNETYLQDFKQFIEECEKYGWD